MLARSHVVPATDDTRPAGLLSRRTALTAALLGPLSIAGCGIRLEDGVHLPLAPTRTPLAAESALRDLLSNARALAAAVRTSSAPYAAALAPVLTAQAQSLAQVLHAAGVPADLLVPTTAPATTAPRTPPVTTPTPTAPSTPTTPATPTGALPTVPALAQQGLWLLGGLTSIDPALRAPVTAVLASRWALAREVRGGAPVLAALEPGDWPTTSVASLVAATRAAIYGFEVVTAQSGPAPSQQANSEAEATSEATVPVSPQRTSAADTLAALRRIDGELSGLTVDLPPAPMGYDLPFPVNSPASAKQLAATVTSRLRVAYGTQLTGVPDGAGAMSAMVNWLGQAEWLAHTWGNAWEPFPGMRLP